MTSEASGPILILGVVAAIAIVFALFVGGMMASGTGMMGGMMGGSGTGPGVWDAGVVALAIAVAGIAIALAIRSRPRAASSNAPAMAWPAPIGAPAPSPAGGEGPTAGADAARLERFQEAAVVRALDEDERTLYIRIREGGGTALQRDIVGWGTFSKAKVTRLLDKLERKGLVVRERYGATNRVRLSGKGTGNA